MSAIHKNAEDTETFLQIVEAAEHLSHVKALAENVTNDLKILRKRDRANVAIIERFTEDNQTLTQHNKDLTVQKQKLQADVNHLLNELAETKRALKESERVANEEKQKLREESARARELEQYRVELRVDDRKNIGKKWSEMWSWVNQLATQYFAEDLDPDTLQAVAGWKDGISHKYSADFPLPPTNATEAKQMRIIAVHFIIASALTRHIFRPADRDDAFAKITSAVASKKPDLESFHRSSYLMVVEQLPGYKSTMIERAVKGAINEIVEEVGSIILSNERAEQFREDVENLCKEVQREWQDFQLCKERYEPDMSGDKHNYDPVPLWENPTNPKRSSPKVNGAEKKPIQDHSGHNQKGKQQQPSTPAADGRAHQSTIVTSVWPSLRVPTEKNPIYWGLALFADQTKEAKEQVMRLNRQSNRNGAKQDEQKSSPRPPSLVAFLPVLSKSG